MKPALLIFLLLSFTQMLYSQKEMKTVPSVDLKKYAGLWYEYSKIPNSFQKQCISNTTAEYKLLEDGTIQVINTCTDEDGEKDFVSGIARIVDRKSKAKLEVSFFSILGWRPVWGDYWVIGLGKNYEYAVIGTPNRKYGWILTRSTKLSDEQIREINQILTEQGYDVKKFVKSRHSN
jgi:apolipoprotein D and lipocalin family protein